jgi:hypothetical protein
MCLRLFLTAFSTTVAIWRRKDEDSSEGCVSKGSEGGFVPYFKMISQYLYWGGGEEARTS